MQPLRILSIALVAALLLSASAASAFSTDDKSLNDANGAPRFSDPDEQMPVQIFSPGNQSSNFGQHDDNGDAQAPSNYAPTAAPFTPSNNYSPSRH